MCLANFSDKYPLTIINGVRIINTAKNAKQFNPLSPNSDERQFSPNDIHTMSRDKIMRINKMIT